MTLFKATVAFVFIGVLSAPAFAQGPVTPPAAGENAQSVLQAVQQRINAVHTMQATLEYDEKDDDKIKLDENGEPIRNPEWDEPPGRDVERGPIFIRRNVGAYLRLQRKNKVEEFVANSNRLWKYEHKEKEAKFVPSSWPIVNNFVSNALVMNAFVAMDSNSIKYVGTQPVEGENCWILEGKSPSKLAMVGAKQIKLKMWIAQADGIPRLIHTGGKDDLYIRLKGVVINQPVDDSKFQFTPPSGVKVKNIFGF